MKSPIDEFPALPLSYRRLLVPRTGPPAPNRTGITGLEDLGIFLYATGGGVC